MSITVSAFAADGLSRWQDFKDAGEQAEIEHDFKRAEQWYRKALPEAEKVGASSPQLLETLARLATCIVLQDRLEEAVPYYKRAMAIAMSSKRVNSDGEDLVWLDDIADAYEQKANAGAAAKAEMCYGYAIEIREKISGGKHSKLPNAYWSLGQIYLLKRRYKDAIAYVEKAYKLHTAHNKIGFWPARDLCSLGEIYLKLGEYGKARSNLLHSMEVTKFSTGAVSPLMANVQRTLGDVDVAENKLNDAEKLYLAALKIDQLSGPAGILVCTYDLDRLGILYDKKGNLAKSVQYFRQSFAIKEKCFGRKHKEVAIPALRLAAALRKVHRDAEAAKLEAQAHAAWPTAKLSDELN